MFFPLSHPSAYVRLSDSGKRISQISPSNAFNRKYQLRQEIAAASTQQNRTIATHEATFNDTAHFLPKFDCTPSTFGPAI